MGAVSGPVTCPKHLGCARRLADALVRRCFFAIGRPGGAATLVRCLTWVNATAAALT
jgi:hypothetical protein